MRGPRHIALHVHPGFLACASAVVGCVVVLGACGSSGKSSGSTGAPAAIRFAGCMRSHGVPNFPDPSGGGGGIKLDASSGINPQSPAFRAAQRACSSLLPGGGPFRRPVPETRKLAMLRLAQCMRRHGLTTFPDPTSSPPSPGSGGGMGLAFGAPGSFIAVPQALLRSPGFQQAAAACGFPGIGRHNGSKSAAAP